MEMMRVVWRCNESGGGYCNAVGVRGTLFFILLQLCMAVLLTVLVIRIAKSKMGTLRLQATTA